MERVGWIDFLRGFSMILILAFHTEVYYKEEAATPYYIYTSNAIILFYFISGYLFYRQEAFQLKKRLKSIVRSMLFPYFIFTSLIAIPKLMVRHSEINWMEIATNILTGNASWFIAALIIAEIFFSLLLWISRGKYIWLSIAAIVCFITYFIIPIDLHSFWQWHDALLALFFLYLGYVCHQKSYFFHMINSLFLSLLLLIVLIIIKVGEYYVDLPMRNIAINHACLFLSDAVIWLIWVISIIRYIPKCKMIEWTGKYSIIYYFLCGGCPLITSMLMNRIGFSYDGFLYRYLLTLVVVYIFATAITWFIVRYIPILTGKR